MRLDGSDGRCVVCGAAPGGDCDDGMHATVRERGWIVHGTYDQSHFADQPPGECTRCRVEKLLPPAPVLEPPEEVVGLMARFMAAGRAQALDIVPFVHEKRPGAVVWMIVGRPSPGQVELFAMPLPLQLGHGWIPLGPDGQPAGAATGAVPQEPPRPPNRAERRRMRSRAALN